MDKSLDATIGTKFIFILDDHISFSYIYKIVGMYKMLDTMTIPTTKLRYLEGVLYKIKVDNLY